MQTAKSEIQGHNNSEREHVRIFLDSGSQRTYVTVNLAEKLKLKTEIEKEIKLVTFGSDKPKTVKIVPTS